MRDIMQMVNEAGLCSSAAHRVSDMAPEKNERTRLIWDREQIWLSLYRTNEGQLQICDVNTCVPVHGNRNIDLLVREHMEIFRDDLADATQKFREAQDEYFRTTWA